MHCSLSLYLATMLSLLFSLFLLIRRVLYSLQPEAHFNFRLAQSRKYTANFSHTFNTYIHTVFEKGSTFEGLGVINRKRVFATEAQCFMALRLFVCTCFFGKNTLLARELAWWSDTVEFVSMHIVEDVQPCNLCTQGSVVLWSAMNYGSYKASEKNIIDNNINKEFFKLP